MAYDRTVGLRIRNLFHFRERWEAGRKVPGLSSFSKERGGLVWDEEIVWFPNEVCMNEALGSFCHLHLVAESLNCEELPYPILFPRREAR